MIKVLHVAWSLRFGGIEKLLLDLMNYQKSQENINSDLLVGQKHGEFVKLFDKAQITLFDLDLKGGMDLRISKLKSAKVLMKKYDVIHFHSFTPIMAIAAKLSKAKILYTIHGGFGFGRKTRPQDRILKTFKKLFLNKYAHLISCNSEFTLALAKDRLGLINHSSIKVIYNGIDLQAKIDGALKEGVNTELREKMNSKFVIGTVSRFAGFKRIDRLVKAFSKMINMNGSLLVLVGDGPLRVELEALVKKLGVTDNVYFTSYQENVSPFQNAMDVCVYPSQNEPFGLVAVESLALGKEVVVFEDGGGLVEIVGGVSKNNVVSTETNLTQKLDLLFNNQKGLEKTNKKYKKYAQKFSVEKMGSEFNQAYFSLIQSDLT